MVNASLAYIVKVLQHPLLTKHKNVEWDKIVDESYNLTDEWKNN